MSVIFQAINFLHSKIFPEIFHSHWKCMCVYIYIQTHLHIYIYIYVYVYTYIYIPFICYINFHEKSPMTLSWRGMAIKVLVVHVDGQRTAVDPVKTGDPTAGADVSFPRKGDDLWENDGNLAPKFDIWKTYSWWFVGFLIWKHSCMSLSMPILQQNGRSSMPRKNRPLNYVESGYSIYSGIIRWNLLKEKPSKELVISQVIQLAAAMCHAMLDSYGLSHWIPKTIHGSPFPHWVSSCWLGWGGEGKFEADGLMSSERPGQGDFVKQSNKENKELYKIAWLIGYREFY